jgi:hypothetical protein
MLLAFRVDRCRRADLRFRGILLIVATFSAPQEGARRGDATYQCPRVANGLPFFQLKKSASFPGLHVESAIQRPERSYLVGNTNNVHFQAGPIIIIAVCSRGFGGQSVVGGLPRLTGLDRCAYTLRTITASTAEGSVARCNLIDRFKSGTRNNRYRHSLIASV